MDKIVHFIYSEKYLDKEMDKCSGNDLLQQLVSFLWRL